MDEAIEIGTDQHPADDVVDTGAGPDPFAGTQHDAARPLQPLQPLGALPPRLGGMGRDADGGEFRCHRVRSCRFGRFGRRGLSSGGGRFIHQA